MVNTLFNRVLGENEKCVFYFYLKTEGTFWPNQYNLYLVEYPKRISLKNYIDMAYFRK